MTGAHMRRALLVLASALLASPGCHEAAAPLLVSAPPAASTAPGALPPAPATDAASAPSSAARSSRSAPRLFVDGGLSGVVCAMRGDALACSKQLELPAGAVGVAISLMHTCAWTADGHAFCGGYNKDGRVGLGTKTDNERMAQVPGLEHVTRMALTARSSCAVTSDGAAFCWGDDRSLSPVRVAGVEHAVDLRTGQEPRCFLQEDGAVARWAFNTPAAVPFPGLGSITNLGGCAPTAVCGAHTDGTVSCVATGEFSKSFAISTSELSSLHGVVAVASDAVLGCALSAEGTVQCWGGSKAPNGGAPFVVSELTNVRALAAGSDRVCALRGGGDGEVWCVSDGEPTRAHKVDLR
jgi:hypothetical protein